jgi:hypothetical protein
LKLSSSQARVVKLMQDGWLLSMGMSAFTLVLWCHLSKKRPDGYQENARVVSRTIDVLEKKKLIRRLEKTVSMFYETRFELTAEGKAWRDV